MAEKDYRKIQCKTRGGISCRWTIGKTKDGKFKAISVRSARKGLPTSFLPFEVMDAVLGAHSPRFDTLDGAEAYVRSI